MADPKQLVGDKELEALAEMAYSHVAVSGDLLMQLINEIRDYRSGLRNGIANALRGDHG